MALFTDGIIASADDLRAYESSVIETANTEGIDLDAKLELSQRGIGEEIYRLLVDQTAAEGRPPKVNLNQVTVTESLFQWHILYTLELIFRDAYHNQLNDRYRAKWAEYEKHSSAAKDRLFDVGLGVVQTPAPNTDQSADYYLRLFRRLRRG